MLKMMITFIAATILGAALNAEFSARLRVEQQLRREIRNSLRLPPDDPISGQDMVLPANNLRAGKYLAFDALGAPLPASGTGNDAALRADLASTTVGVSGTALLGFRRPESGSVAEAVYDILRRQVRLMSFGADNTGVASSTAALDAAIAACAALNHSTLIVDHGEGFLSIYGNNESLLKQTGDPVSLGEALAVAGQSGGNEETGLYFELRHLGRPFDPISWVRLK